jgi:hypothetical protein
MLAGAANSGLDVVQASDTGEWMEASEEEDESDEDGEEEDDETDEEDESSEEEAEVQQQVGCVAVGALGRV